MSASEPNLYRGNYFTKKWVHINHFLQRRANRIERRIESLDFEEVDGELLRQHNGHQKHWTAHGVATYAVCFAIAGFIALINVAVYKSTDGLIEVRNNWVEGELEKNEKEAAGAGMPEVIAFLNGTSPKKAHTWKTLVIKLIGMIGVVGGGLFSGYDGPMAHVGCLVALSLLRFIKRVPALTRAFYHEHDIKSIEEGKKDDQMLLFRIQHHRIARLFGATSSSAAVASTFRAPLGGVGFALEEAISFFEPDLIIQCLFASIVAYVIGAWLVVGDPIEAGGYNLLGSTVSCNVQIPIYDVLNLVAMGIAFGLAGALYNFILLKVRMIRGSLTRRRPLLRIAYLLIVVLITSAVVVFIPRNYGCRPYEEAFTFLETLDCKVSCEADDTGNVFPTLVGSYECMNPCLSQMGSNKYAQLADAVGAKVCPSTPQPQFANMSFIDLVPIANAVIEGEYEFKYLFKNTEENCYYEMRSLIMSAPEQTLKLISIRGAYDLFRPGTLGIFAAVYLPLSLLASALPLPTDLVLPNLILGALYGRFWGIMTNWFKTQAGQTLVDPGAYAIFGMAGMWSAVSHLPLTVALVIIETSMEMKYLASLCIVAIIATLVAARFGESMYHVEIVSKKLPFLPSHANKTLRTSTIKELMIPAKTLITVNRKETILSLIEKIRDNRGNGFPVVEPLDRNDPTKGVRLLGICLREAIVNRLFQTRKVRNETIQQSMEALSNSRILSMDDDSRVEALTLRVPPRESAPTARPGSIFSAKSAALGGLESVIDNLVSRASEVIDLTNLTNWSPAIVYEDMTASKAFDMFRHLTLRHMCVIDRKGRFKGLITRGCFTVTFDEHYHAHPGLERTDTGKSKHSVQINIDHHDPDPPSQFGSQILDPTIDHTVGIKVETNLAGSLSTSRPSLSDSRTRRPMSYVPSTKPQDTNPDSSISSLTKPEM